MQSDQRLHLAVPIEKLSKPQNARCTAASHLMAESGSLRLLLPHRRMLQMGFRRQFGAERSLMGMMSLPIIEVADRMTTLLLLEGMDANDVAAVDGSAGEDGFDVAGDELYCWRSVPVAVVMIEIGDGDGRQWLLPDVGDDTAVAAAGDVSPNRQCWWRMSEHLAVADRNQAAFTVVWVTDLLLIDARDSLLSLDAAKKFICCTITDPSTISVV
ncbi:hypothetical protein ACLOJK_031130 [Asimina triloba]